MSSGNLRQSYRPCPDHPEAGMKRELDVVRRPGCVPQPVRKIVCNECGRVLERIDGSDGLKMMFG